MRAQTELAPIPEFRRTVGKSSDDKMYMVPNAPAMPSLPVSARTVVTHCRAVRKSRGQVNTKFYSISARLLTELDIYNEK